jgi:Kazal-type serine protease inhibitor-like protein
MRLASLLAAALLLIAGPGNAGAPAPLCGAGVFAVAGESLVPDPDFDLPDLVTLEGDTLQVASGTEAEVSLRPTRRGTVLRGRLAVPYTGRRPFAGSQFENEMAAVSWNVLMGLVNSSPNGGASRPVKPPRIKALIDPECRVMTGTLRGRGLRRDFVATAVYGDAVCGTIVGIPCGGGTFCELPEDTCSSADLAGVCVPVGVACPQYWEPVCGCDGVTYGNDCERGVAGAQKAHDGACEDAPSEAAR